MTKLWLALLAPSLGLGAPASTNPASPPKIIQLSVPLNGRAAVEVNRAGLRGATALKGIVALPQDFDPRRSWPVLLVTAPSGSSAVRSLSSYTNVALAQGWVVAAIDGPKVNVEKDNNVFAWAMISSLLDQLRLSWPQSKGWPFACAGFSGGAKRAAMTAAEMMRQRDVVIGVFMGGCNEDRATLGYQISRPGDGFLGVPMFLSNGTRDPIAGALQGSTVKQSMEQTGFRKVRLESYDDQHRLDTNQLRIALEWFRPAGKNALSGRAGTDAAR
jgi:hypothetical protein